MSGLHLTLPSLGWPRAHYAVRPSSSNSTRASLPVTPGWFKFYSRAVFQRSSYACIIANARTVTGLGSTPASDKVAGAARRWPGPTRNCICLSHHAGPCSESGRVPSRAGAQMVVLAISESARDGRLQVQASWPQGFQTSLQTTFPMSKRRKVVCRTLKSLPRSRLVPTRTSGPKQPIRLARTTISVYFSNIVIENHPTYSRRPQSHVRTGPCKSPI